MERSQTKTNIHENDLNINKRPLISHTKAANAKYYGYLLFFAGLLSIIGWIGAIVAICLWIVFMLVKVKQINKTQFCLTLIGFCVIAAWDF